MKKVMVLGIGIIVGMVFILSSHVFAAELQWAGEYRVRGRVQDYQTAEKKNNAPTSFWDQRFRLDMEAVASDNLKGVIGLDIGNDGDADGGVWGTDHSTVSMYLAYLDITIPDTPVNVKMGTQTITYGHSIIVDDEFDSVLLSISPDPDKVTISGLVAKATENETNTSDDEDLYGVVVSLTPEENIGIGMLAAYLHDGDASGNASRQGNLFINNNFDDLTGYWLGLSADIAVEPLTIAAEIDYMNLKYHALTSGTKDFKASGWATYLNVGIAPTDMVTVGSEFIYSTGDDDNSADKYEGFADISNDFNVATWEDDIVVEGHVADAGLVSTWGVMGPRLYAIISPTEELKLKAKMGYYWREEEPTATGKGNEDTIGLEFDGFVYYDLMENLQLKTFACYLFSDEDACGEKAEDLWRMGQRVRYTF